VKLAAKNIVFKLPHAALKMRPVIEVMFRR
jgi:hypothetical protein